MKDCEHMLGYFGYDYEIVLLELKEDHPILEQLIEGYRKDKYIEWFDYCPHCGVKLDRGYVVRKGKHGKEKS